MFEVKDSENHILLFCSDKTNKTPSEPILQAVSGSFFPGNNENFEESSHTLQIEQDEIEIKQEDELFLSCAKREIKYEEEKVQEGGEENCNWDEGRFEFVEVKQEIEDVPEIKGQELAVQSEQEICYTRRSLGKFK